MYLTVGPIMYDQWRMINDGWTMMDDQWYMTNDSGTMMEEGLWMTYDGYQMMAEQRGYDDNNKEVNI